MHDYLGNMTHPSMTTVHVSQERGRHLRRRPSGKSQLLLPLIVFAAVAFTAFVYTGYVLWPRWPTPRLDAPALPITVAGVAFNLPPAAFACPCSVGPARKSGSILLFYGLRSSRPIRTQSRRRPARRLKPRKHSRACS